ncbi:MAG TPA: thiamine-phosphate pyrophosphorylase [Candidatus Omnitrophota bacterium]|nr:thiamine-phosphate pyrophosphorylase [Candidatus Omnitrophota bacterium]HPT07635.1 thiamine-phosphate pyrophosphorylase [Candidatus Omnitrophota bacterium]
MQKTCINRIIDANINRAKEGLRVCEELARFVIENKPLTEQLKNTRHAIDAHAHELASRTQLLASRNSTHDIGQKVYGKELHRKNFHDIFFANIQRVKESIRVLEEFSKLKRSRSAVSFKNLRYRIYEIEKKSSALVNRSLR